MVYLKSGLFVKIHELSIFTIRENASTGKIPMTGRQFLSWSNT